MKDPRYKNHRRGCECAIRFEKQVELGKLADKFKSEELRLKLEDMRIVNGNLERACVKPGYYL